MNASPRAVMALAATCAALSLSAHAADTIATDRPDFVESSDVVGRGRVQIETGFASERSKADGATSRMAVTPTLLRLGFNDVLEVRVETDGAARTTVTDASGTQRERGTSDASLGLKYHLQDGDDAGKAGLALLFHVDMDTGSGAYRGQGLRPSLRGVAEWELPNNFSVGVMPGVAFDKNDSGKRFAAGILAVTVGKEWSPAWKTFVELSGQQLTSKKNGGSVVTFDAGVTYLVTDSVQLDFSIARGLTADSPDFQWGVGLSVRF
ncbi:MAG: transporter [Rhizobacter sp.]